MIQGLTAGRFRGDEAMRTVKALEVLNKLVDFE